MSEKQSKSNAVNENKFYFTNQFKNAFSFCSPLTFAKTKGKSERNSKDFLKKQEQKLSTTNANVHDKNDYGFTLDKQKQKNINLHSITFLNTQKSELLLLASCESKSKRQKREEYELNNIIFSNLQHDPITVLETHNLSPLPFCSPLAFARAKGKSERKKICSKTINAFSFVESKQKENQEKELFIIPTAENATIFNNNKMNLITRTENYGGRRTGGNLNSRDTNWKSRDGRNRNRDMGRKKQRNKYKQDQSAPKLPKGIINIQCTLNNTILTFANLRGKVIGWQSAGTSGFKGARKSTPYAAKTAAKAAAQQAIAKGLTRAKVIVKGGGPGRDNALRGLAEAKLEMTVIRDVTGLPHNGCRPRKKRRV